MVVPIILAAGASSRMGTPKALCDFGGVSALAMVLEVCREAGSGPPVVVLGYEAERIRSAVDLGGARQVENPRPQEGQTSSLQCGLRVLPDDATAFLLFPVDHPLVQAADVRALLQAHAANPDAQVCTLSHEGRRGHPVLVTRSLVPALLDLPPTRGARDVINAADVKTFYIASTNPGISLDMDTPDDYHALLALQHNRTTP